MPARRMVPTLREAPAWTQASPVEGGQYDVPAAMKRLVLSRGGAGGGPDGGGGGARAGVVVRGAGRRLEPGALEAGARLDRPAPRRDLPGYGRDLLDLHRGVLLRQHELGLAQADALDRVREGRARHDG